VVQEVYWASQSGDGFQADLGYALRDHVELLRSSIAEVDDATRLVPRATVVDADHDRPVIRKVDNTYESTEREVPGGGCKSMHVKDFSAGGGAAMELSSIPGGLAENGFVL
jgi:hypothetical protein